MERDDPTRNRSTFSGGEEVMLVHDSSNIKMVPNEDPPERHSEDSAPDSASDGEHSVNDPGSGGHADSNPESNSGSSDSDSEPDGGSSSDSQGSDDSDGGDFGDSSVQGRPTSPPPRNRSHRHNPAAAAGPAKQIRKSGLIHPPWRMIHTWINWSGRKRN